MPHPSMQAVALAARWRGHSLTLLQKPLYRSDATIQHFDNLIAGVAADRAPSFSGDTLTALPQHSAQEAI